MRRLIALALLALAPACSNKSDETSLPPPTEGQLDPIPNPHEGTVTPLPDPEAQSGSVGRAPRRLTVDQLDKSITTTVGRPWTDLNKYAPSLGRADYALVNTENTEPNLVFAKFLEDGARVVCLAQATDEVKKSATTQHVLTATFTTPTGPVGDLTKLTDAQVTDAVVYLSTRFWGSPLQGEELPKWKNFFTQAATRSKTINKPEQALAAVCIALMTDSRFLTY
ncbi:hypothetical protein [Hyalangium versicolor]|uniref:hypothetical protein n=1 Tax=Hyalangium versicolor TaxID=2861190 RepID=UPI001CC963FE|nr:hypothetical protein [Hyalangium versicolor]